MPRHRRCLVVRGRPDETARQAAEVVAGLSPGDVLWVGRAAPPPIEAVAPAAVGRRLGRSCDAAVLDLHGGLDPDVLGQVHGMVAGPGALILRLPPAGRLPDGQSRLAVWPHPPAAVGHRLWQRLERMLADHRAVQPPSPLRPTPDRTAGTPEQADLVAVLADQFAGPGPSRTLITADRGRGKSAALGLALADALRRRPDLRVAATTPPGVEATELRRFAPAAPLVDVADLLGADPLDVIVVDEAARLPVSMLQAIVAHHPQAHLAFATTTRGYEGTGRGFVLRFVAWLRAQRPAPLEATLDSPLRWDAGDPLEDLVYGVLALDARPHAVDGRAAHAVVVDRDALARDEALLRGLFGLLVHAHYRTTPSDLHRLLDAPNLSVHAMLAGDRVLAATVVAREGGLPASTCADLATGRLRLRGHALPETLAHHTGHPEAGGLRAVRSVRIATHPDARRRGLARALVEHVHAVHRPDWFGTLFGATADVVGFRRALGYTLVRVGVSRGRRTGEPAAVMVRPCSPRAVELTERLRRELARDLPAQLDRMAAEDPVGIARDLRTALQADLPPAAAWLDASRRATVHAYLHHGRPFEAAAGALARTVGPLRNRLPPDDRALIEGRLFDRRSWARLTRELQLNSVPATMRALRRALVALLEPDKP